MPTELIKYLPQQWVGLLAIVLIGVYAVSIVAERSAIIAKFLPFGTKWHEYQKKRRQISQQEVATAVEVARQSWINDENAALVALERRMSSIAQTSEQQANDIRDLQTTVRAFTAWSQYDARWHHRHVVEMSDTDCVVPQHYDFFAFELLWRTDPYKAAQLG